MKFEDDRHEGWLPVVLADGTELTKPLKLHNTDVRCHTSGGEWFWKRLGCEPKMKWAQRQWNQQPDGTELCTCTHHNGQCPSVEISSHLQTASGCLQQLA